MNKRKTGSLWEDKACMYLSRQGYEIIERNYRCKIGEVDIIARQDDTYVFVEVKFRSDTAYGYSYEAVTPSKQRTIRKVAKYYLTVELSNTDVPCRFDVLGFDMIEGQPEITHIVNAF